MRNKIFTGIVALQALFILGMTAVHETRLKSKTTVLLETVPVDPRDLLRGDYVILSYKISSIPRAMLDPASEEMKPGMTVHVLLEPRGEFHEAVRASTRRLEPDNGQILIQGLTEESWDAGSIRLKYGLERYYVPEGTGNPSGRITVKAALAANGQAAIRELYQDGVPFREAIRGR